MVLLLHWDKIGWLHEEQVKQYTRTFRNVCFLKEKILMLHSNALSMYVFSLVWETRGRSGNSYPTVRCNKYLKSDWNINNFWYRHFDSHETTILALRNLKLQSCLPYLCWSIIIAGPSSTCPAAKLSRKYTFVSRYPPSKKHFVTCWNKRQNDYIYSPKLNASLG